MKGLDEYKEIMFFGGGIMAERLYDQLENIESRLCGVIDLLDERSRKITGFKGIKIKNAGDCKEELQNENIAIIVAIGHYNVYRIVSDF